MATRIRGASLAVMREAGHLAPFEDAQVFVALLAAFLDRR
ncbi:MAG: alpha/beta hydrolase, partial [Zoogloeaceae bacterium]|nr:alpha/beta hydrolase [Zoogloeaceae bacterium]